MGRKWIYKIKHHEKKEYSQGGQDGVIEFIFNKLGVKDKSAFCVEFGFNSDNLDGGSGSNVANLVLNNSWDSLLLDADYDNPDINLHKHFLTSDNICEIFKSYNVPNEPEYISIDVDSTDLWLFKAILSKYRPMVMSVEYNAHFPIHRAITMHNRTDIITYRQGRRRKKRLYGASLMALNMVGCEFEYSLVYVVKGMDAFFIRNDLIKDCDIPNIDYFKKKTYINWHSKQKDKEFINVFLDYEEYIRTGGDVDKSREVARKICKECISKRIKRKKYG